MQATKALTPAPVSAALITLAAVAVIGFALPAWLLLAVDIIQVDEAVYSACAVRLNLVGEWPLVGCRDSKPPVLFLLYQSVFGVFGAYNLVASRLLALALGMLAAWLIALAARRLAGAPAGIWAAAIYLLALLCAPDRVFLSTEAAGQPFVAAALYLVIRAAQERSLAAAALAGLAMAGAVLSKQPYLLVSAGIGGVLASHIALPGALGRAEALRLSSTMAAAAALALGLVALAYVAHGAWDAFWYQIYRYPAAFSAEHSANFVTRQAHSIAAFGRYVAWLYWMCLAIAAAVYALLHAAPDSVAVDRDHARRLLLIALPVSYLAVGLGDESRIAYVAMVFPVAAAIAGIGTRLLIGEDRASTRVTALVAAALLLGAVSNVVQARDAAGPPLDQHRNWPIAREINALKRDGDRLEVWGWQPHFYVATGLAPLSHLSLTHMIVGAFVVEFRAIPDEERRRIAEPDAVARYVESLRAHRGRFFFVDAGAAPYMGFERHPIASVPALASFVAERCTTLVERAQIKRWDWHPSAYLCRGRDPGAS
jgi:4-amino-4-deoxy-L-arabinose transferase-like glycosyltransferase